MAETLESRSEKLPGQFERGPDLFITLVRASIATGYTPAAEPGGARTHSAAEGRTTERKNVAPLCRKCDAMTKNRTAQIDSGIASQVNNNKDAPAPEARRPYQNLIRRIKERQTPAAQRWHPARKTPSVWPCEPLYALRRRRVASVHPHECF